VVARRAHNPEVAGSNPAPATKKIGAQIQVCAFFKEKEVKLLAIVGSPRPKGNTNYLVDQALGEAAKLGIQTEKIVLSQYRVNPCLGHDDCSSFESCTQKDDANWILDAFLDADGVILATPVYWYNVSAQMKAFIDRNYFPYKHNRKYKARTVGIIVVAEMEAIDDTVHTLNQFVDWCFDIKADHKFIVSGYAHKIGDAKKNATLVEQAKKLGAKMAESLKGANFHGSTS
jgi:multimeric flavodoxin WrbA